MLYGVFTNCTSLREIQHGLEICQGKLNHLNLSRVPPRSTLSDGNKSRPAKVFGTIHQKLSETYKSLIPDSTLKANIAKRLFIPHGTINSFLKAVQKPTGRERSVGKSKGGMKVNTLPQAEKHMPAFYQIHGRCPALLVPNIIREPAVLQLHKKIARLLHYCF